MAERISRLNDEKLYQPRLHSRRIKQIYQVAKEQKIPMTNVLDSFVERGVKEYNGGMDTLETSMERLANNVEYFNLQKTDGGWLLSFVHGAGETFEEENLVLNHLISKASKVVFSSEVSAEVGGSPAPPSPRNR